MLDWTDGKRRSFIVGVLRAGARRWPPKIATMNLAKTEKKINPKTGRLAQHFTCNVCQGEFTSKDMQVDHILPVVEPGVGFVSWDTYIERLFCEQDNLQAICTTCHDAKTKAERPVKVRKKKNETN